MLQSVWKKKKVYALCETLLPRKECKIASVFYEKDQTLKPVKLFPIFMDVEVQGKVQWGFDLHMSEKKKRELHVYFSYLQMAA